jgi:hypothetical protein
LSDFVQILWIFWTHYEHILAHVMSMV